MRLFLSVLVPVLILFSAACEPAGSLDPDNAHGEVSGTVRWSGAVTVTGDIIIQPGGELVIEPGTTVIVKAGQDVEAMSHLGEHDDLTADDPAYTEQYEKSHITIIVNGELTAQGTADKPIRFASSAATPHYTDWVGIMARKVTATHLIVEWSRDGIGVMEGHAGIDLRDSVVRHAWASCVNIQKPANAAASRIEGNTIRDCGHEAIDTHDPGPVSITRNLIIDAQAGPNMNGDLAVTISRNIIVNTAMPILLNTPTGEVFITQNTLQAATQDVSRWTYEGFSLPQMTPAVAVVASPHAAGKSTVVNTIVFDSPYGLFNGSAAAMDNGYLNFDGVATAFFDHATPGAGVLYEGSGFVDKGAGDYHLSSDSPLKGKGNPADGAPDIGAYDGTEDYTIGSALDQ